MIWGYSDQRSSQAHNRLDDGLGLVWAMVAKSSGQWSDFGLIAHFSLIRGYFGLGWSDQRLL